MPHLVYSFMFVQFLLLLLPGNCSSLFCSGIISSRRGLRTTVASVRQHARPRLLYFTTYGTLIE